LLSFYLLREQYNPGYLQAVWNNELGGRFGSPLEEHHGPFTFYLHRLATLTFVPWIYFLPLAFWLGHRHGGREGRLILFLSLALLFFYLVISLAGTKLFWYDAPAFPLLALMAALGIDELRRQLVLDRSHARWLSLLLLFALLAFPYYRTVKRLHDQRNTDPQAAYGLFMRSIPEQREYLLTQMGYNATVLFYEKMYNRKGYRIRRQHPSHFQPGDTVLVCEPKAMALLEEWFYFDQLMEKESCRLLSIHGKKEKPEGGSPPAEK
jgi:4-amino-4-deoxy-L-arabinose transferase-like glycosyltransferase